MFSHLRQKHDRLEDRTGPLFCTPGVASTPVSRHNPRGSFGTPPCVTSFEHGWAAVAKQSKAKHAVLMHAFDLSTVVVSSLSQEGHTS